MKEYDVVIVGAGPAGATGALALKGSGLRVAVLDKAVFPRDKVCGDAIPTCVVQILQAIDPAVAQAFEQFADKVEINGSRIVAPNQRACELRYSEVGYVSCRIDPAISGFSRCPVDSPISASGCYPKPFRPAALA